jgi:hypothetical protein
MRAAGLDTVILQAVEIRNANGTTRSFLPSHAKAYDPVKASLDYADSHPGMTVFLGLRLDENLGGSEFLNNAGQLQRELAEELPQNLMLATTLARRYHLKRRKSFGGWYLPTEIGNFPVPPLVPGVDWVSQLNVFTRQISARCTALVPKPVAVSPYFNSTIMGNACPAGMGQIVTRFLVGTDVSIVMLQDGVGAADVPAARVADYVIPFLVAVAQACQQLSTPMHPVYLWLNVESYNMPAGEKRVPTDIERLKVQLQQGEGLVSKIVTFDFPDYLGMDPLYGDYLAYVSSVTTGGHPDASERAITSSGSAPQAVTTVRPQVRQCQCAGCIELKSIPINARHRRLNVLFSQLSADQRRYYAALESVRIGRGGDRIVSLITGIDVATIRQGREQLAASRRGRDGEDSPPSAGPRSVAGARPPERPGTPAHHRGPDHK